MSVKLQGPVRFEKWGRAFHGFYTDTCKNQAATVLRVRDVPGVPRSQNGWVLLALQIHNNKNYVVDRRNSLEPRSICFLFFGMVIGIVIIGFIIAVIVLMFGFQPSYYVRG